MKKLRILLILLMSAVFIYPVLSSAENFLVISDIHFTEEIQENHSAAREAVIRAARGKEAAR